MCNSNGNKLFRLRIHVLLKSPKFTQEVGRNDKKRIVLIILASNLPKAFLGRYGITSFSLGAEQTSLSN
jgi:hypothetical protein